MFATSATCVTKLTLVAKAAFIWKSLCFEVFKVLFSQFVDRMLENKSLHERDPPPHPHQENAPAPLTPVKNGRSPAELKFRENTGFKY